jgi:hypothetical protein
MMSLQDWLNKKWIIPHRTSAQEIGDLFRIADRDIIQSQIPGLDNDTRLSIAYNAALQCCAASLAAAGYRASHEAHHYRLIQSLKYTLHIDASIIGLLDDFRKKRNISDYERAGTVSLQEATEMIELAAILRKLVHQWLCANSPGLMKE